MNWTRAIEVNRLALTRVVAELFAMLGIVNGLSIERMLRPAEAALRRLIVIVAHGLVVKAVPSRPMPKGLVIARNTTGRKSFQLRNPYNPFDQMYWPRPKPATKTDHLPRRLEALKHALETLPRQAMRLVRWQAKRAAMQNPKFTSPLRPGRPPGHRANPKLEIDYILKECHALAWDVSCWDSS
jgi:hypothetical protein